MEFFIDTADVQEIRQANAWGVIEGVTTNPSLIAQSGRTQDDVIKEITQIVDGPISAEVIATDAKGMINEGKSLAAINPNIVIKLPMSPEGMEACQYFYSQEIQTNVTLVFSANQALLAAKSGATYVSPFVGRLDDIGQDGMQLIDEIRIIFDNYAFQTKILAASLRHPQHVKQAAMVGADVATLPFAVIKKLFHHPLTDKGLEQFLKDHQASLS